MVIWTKDGYLNAPLAITTKEHTMYAHCVSVHLKPNSAAAFTQRLEEQVIPMLRKQKGFQDEIAFVGPTGTEALGVSLLTFFPES